ncbi:MAG: FtsW/RodA/SpoVE family cell cycle protein [Blautia wexlerae]
MGSFRFQPTELSKIILIVFFAKFFMDHEETLNTLKTLALSGVLLAVPLFLILEQPDLKNTITVVVIFCIMICGCGALLIRSSESNCYCCSIDHYFFINCCPAGSETAQGLPEKPYHVFFVSGKRRILG